jgi:hypothetical protein
MNVYIVTSGTYSDYCILHVFARREDAEAYEQGDRVEEFEVHDGPIEVRAWHELIWNPDAGDHARDARTMGNPSEVSYPKDFDGDERHASHAWYGPPQRTGPVLYVRGWDLARVRKAYSEQRAQYIARHDKAN